jgi:integrase
MSVTFHNCTSSPRRSTSRIHESRYRCWTSLHSLRTQAAEGTLAASNGQAVDGLISDYIAHRVSVGKVRPGKPESKYRGYVRNHVSPIIGGMRLTEVRPVHAQKVIDAMVAAAKAPSSVRQVYAITHWAFKWAVKQRRIAVNPFDAVTLPASRRPRLTTPKAKDTAAILAKVEDDYLVAVKLAAATGLRRGEVCAARWDGLYLDRDHESCSMSPVPHLHVEGTMQRVAGRLTTMPPKSERGRRALPLPPFAVAFLRKHRTEQAERRLLLGEAWTDKDLIVDRGDGKPMALTRWAMPSAAQRSRLGFLASDSTISDTDGRRP